MHHEELGYRIVAYSLTLLNAATRAMRAMRESLEVMKATLRAALEASTRDRLDMTGLLSQLIRSGQPVRGLAYDGEWGEIDSAGDLDAYPPQRAG